MPINQNSRVWDGVYTAFSDVVYEHDAFEDAVWSNKLLERARRVPDAVTSDDALAVVAAVAAALRSPLRILDFGGGLGTAYGALRTVLTTAARLQFVVVENDALCRLGEEVFAGDPNIRFCTAIPESERFDIVHAGSSLHYVDDWRGMIGRFAATGADFVILTDVPAGDIDSFVTTQSFHGRQIPVHFWNIRELSDCVAKSGFDLIFNAPFIGQYLERNASLPTAHFDVRHRLDHFRQLLFRRRATHE